MGRKTTRQRELEALIEYILDRPIREQLTVFRTLAKSLGSKFGEESAVELEAHKRAETLEAMERVRKRVNLPPGTAPTAIQWRSVWREVAPKWSATSVADLWERYEFAKRAFRGEPVPAGPAQRAARRGAGVRGRSHEDPIQGLQMWLDDDPHSPTQEEYTEFVRGHNADVESGKKTGRPLVGIYGLRKALGGVQWTEMLAIARGESDASEAAEKHEAELLGRVNQGLGLVGLQEVELLLGESADRTAELTDDEAFPQPVAFVGGLRVWLASDVGAFRDRRPFPHREPGEMQPLITTSEEVARELRLKNVRGLPATLARLRKRGLAREPDGTIGNAHYWERETMEPWIQATKGRRRRSSR